jgi:hypothetical protein
MLMITNTTATREQVWMAFRQAHHVRLRERYHCILLLMDGQSCLGGRLLQLSGADVVSDREPVHV